MYNFFKNLFKKARPDFTGALLDARTPEEKKDDIHFSEIVGTANVVAWIEKYPNVRKFPDMNQYQTNMCGAYSLRKSLGIMFMQKYGVFLDFFAPDIYQRRVNRPSEGMMLYDMMRIAGEGVTLSQFFSDSWTTDAQAEAIKVQPWQRDVGKIFAVSGDVVLPNDIEVIASVIQTTGKSPVQLTFFNSSEWSREFPIIIDRALSVFNALRHFTAYTDFTLFQGKKYIAMEDSAWFGGINRRFLSEDWIKNRVVEIRYPMNFKFQVASTDKPSYDGQTIISAQKCLRYEGFFPTNIDFAENVGAFSRKALSLFQQKYGLPVTQAIDVATKNKLHELFP